MNGARELADADIGHAAYQRFDPAPNKDWISTKGGCKAARDYYLSKTTMVASGS